MKYLNTREAFLNTLNVAILEHNIINETLTNEVTWGGSLLGRLINSVIRKARIGINLTKVEPIAEEIRHELDKLLFDTLDEVEKIKTNNIKIKSLLSSIYNCIISDEEDSEKLKKLLDKDSNDGLISIAIKEIELSPEDIKSKYLHVADKLKKFKSNLEELYKKIGNKKPDEVDNKKVQLALPSGEKTEDIEELDAEEVNDDEKSNKGQLALGSGKKTIEIGASDKNYKNTLALPSPSNKPEIGKKYIYKGKKGDKIVSIINYIDNDNIRISDGNRKYPIKISDLVLDKSVKVGNECIFKDKIVKIIDLNNQIKTDGTKIPLAKGFVFVKYISTNNTGAVKIDDLKNESILIKSYFDFIERINENDNTEIATIDSKTENDDITNEVSKNVKDIWHESFEEGVENAWKISTEEENEAKNIDSKTKPITDEDLKKEDNKDSILRIANLFGKAYRCYATGTIPSNRPNGKISGQTYREYKYIGKSTPNVPSDTAGPGYGPWANIAVFDKFTNKISEIIEDRKYSKVFSAGSLKRPDNTIMKKGNVLMEFIRDMIDETELKSYEENRSKLLTKYFNLDSSKLSNITPSNTTSGTEVDKAKDSANIRWVNQDTNLPLTTLEKGSFIALNVNYNIGGNPKNGGSVIVGQIISVNDGIVFLKFSYNTEAINNAYSGYRNLPAEEALDGCNNNKKADVRIGVIDLNRTPLDENKKFIMSFLLTNTLAQKDDKSVKKGDMIDKTKIFKHHFTPFKHLKKSGALGRKANVPVCILSKKNDNGKWEPIINNIQVKPSEVDKDINLPNDGKEIFNALLKNLQDDKINIT